MSKIDTFLNDILDEVRNIEVMTQEITAINVVGDLPFAHVKGPEGFGKTSQVRVWAKENNIPLIEFPVFPMTYESDLTNEEIIFQIKSVIKSRLEQEKCVVLFDNYERASSHYKKVIEVLSKSHCLDVDSESYLKNLLFVIIIENGY